MPQTVLSEIAGFITPGTEKVLLIPTVAAFPTITLSEISTTGTDATAQVVAKANWELSVSNPAQATLGSTFTQQARGMRTMSGTPQIQFKGSKTGADIRGSVNVGDTKYVIFGHGGVGTGTFYDAFATEVSNIFVVDDTSGGNQLLITVEFAVTKTPSLYAAYPTS
jgi:hypothetical protein